MSEAVDRGLDMAIVNYSKIYPLYKIPEAEVELARKLIHRDRADGRSAAELHGALRRHGRASSEEAPVAAC